MKRTLLAMIVLLAVCLSAAAQKIYVVSVGIRTYKDPQVNRLRFTENDVASFNKVMATHTNEIYTLVGSQATHANVYNTISRVFSKASSNDVVVLFFSGHGYHGGFCCYDMSRNSGGLSYNEIATLFRKCHAKRKMVFADACFSGGLRKENKGNNTSTNVVRNSDVMFFLSSRTNEESQEMIGGPNGQYTKYLVRGLSGGADSNNDRIVTAKELYNFVHEGVAKATRNRQHPVMWGRFDNTMTVINWNKRR